MARNDNAKDDKKMTVQEAGHLGGEKTAATHDTKYYETIGSEGGSKSGGNFKNDPERASKEGKKGAAAQPTEAKKLGGEHSHQNR